MAYDGRIMRQALARFEEDKQRRGADFARRRDRLYAAEPQLREIEQQLRATMPEMLEDSDFMPTYGWYYYRWHGGSSPADVFTQSMQSAHHVSDAALAASSDSSGGGGGGGFGGGGGGGAF